MIAVSEKEQSGNKAPVSESRERVHSLDCLRAVACLVVVLSHTEKYTTPGGWSIGAYGVGLFCVLSGYLITSILLREENSIGYLDPIRFLQRRCLRILPAYFLLLIPVALLMKTGLFLRNHDELVSQTLAEFPYYVTLTHNLGDGIGINHLWSISVEEQFYCFLPCLLILTRSFAKRQILLASVALCMVPFATLSSHDPYFCNAAFIALIVGTSLSINFERVNNCLGQFPTSAVVVAAIGLVVASAMARMCPYGPVCSLGYALLIWLAVTRFPQFEMLKPLAYVGRISYGVYLVQMPICLVTYWYLNKLSLEHCVPLAFTINVSLSIALGAISWELFEKRILGLRGRIENKPIRRILAMISPVLLILGALLHFFYL